ncbi:hypothetical protein [Streptomyces sp. NPDC060031]|uniref:hypothetical protein n=1 Tax=Streptomyces sp. NPDC060031 TaxID=3347043 RepID=UPI0036A6765E
MEWLVAGELNGAGERGGVEGLRALPRLSTPSVNAVCLYRHGEELTYDAEGKLRAELYSSRQLKKGVAPVDERRVKRKLLLPTVSMPGKWFQGDDRLPVPKAWPRPTRKPLDRSTVLVFDATGACISGLFGQVRYDPRTGLRRLCHRTSSPCRGLDRGPTHSLDFCPRTKVCPSSCGVVAACAA